MKFSLRGGFTQQNVSGRGEEIKFLHVCVWKLIFVWINTTWPLTENCLLMNESVCYRGLKNVLFWNVMIKVYIFTIKNFATILSLFQLILSIRDCYCPAVLNMGYIHSLGKKITCLLPRFRLWWGSMQYRGARGSKTHLRSRHARVSSHCTSCPEQIGYETVTALVLLSFQLHALSWFGTGTNQ